MNDRLTTVTLIVTALLSLAATLVVMVQLRRGESRGLRRVQYSLFGVVFVVAVGLFAYRGVVVHRGWQPLQAHVDGLLMIAALLCPTILFLQRRSRLPGLVSFASPLLTLILAWAVCASWWSFQQFSADTMWKAFHLGTVYIGTISVALAAISGATYLFVENRLHSKRGLSQVRRFASLEALERTMVTAAAVGFALVTLGLVSGLVIMTSGPTRLGPGWWHSPKVVLAVAAWGSYGLLLNVRHATSFRGTRAAWLSIAGLVLLLATFGASTVLPPTPTRDDEPPPEAPPRSTEGAGARFAPPGGRTGMAVGRHQAGIVRHGCAWREEA